MFDNFPFDDIFFYKKKKQNVVCRHIVDDYKRITGNRVISLNASKIVESLSPKSLILLVRRNCEIVFGVAIVLVFLVLLVVLHLAVAA